jgi:peptidoglycan/LPS O-acetylase OafA/YrhL
MHNASGGVFFYFHSLASYTWFCWVGVEIFFVIFGFVIVHASESASPAKFLKSRALQLFPAALICATLTL